MLLSDLRDDFFAEPRAIDHARRHKIDVDIVGPEFEPRSFWSCLAIPIWNWSRTNALPAPRIPKVPPTLTILPPPLAFMTRATAWIRLKGPRTLRRRISSNSSNVVSSPVLPIGPVPPATLIRMSIRSFECRQDAGNRRHRLTGLSW